MRPLQGSIEAEAQSDETSSHGPVPDEDGPHDVPDETVIEKTLPTGPVDIGN